MAETKNKKLDFLEGLRGLAALYVVIHHARWMLWAGYSKGYLIHPESFNIFNKILMYFFSLFIYGHEMVIFFFVLSGFVIHLRYSRNLLNNESDFKFANYFFRRFKRIYPPLIFAILFTFVLDSVGKYYSFPIYGVNSPFKIVKDNLTLKTLSGNCLFLMNTYVGTWGSNFALWSLKFEWWFYMLFPIFFMVLKKSSVVAFAIILLLYLGSLYPGLWPNKLLNEIFSSMIIWWFGVILADIYTARIKIKEQFLISLIVLFPLIITLRTEFSRPVSDVIWGLGFSGLLALFLYLEKCGKSLILLNKLAFAGSFSYSLYIIHCPVIVFFSGYLLKSKHQLPLGFEWVIMISLICVLLAWLIHFLLEQPFWAIKKQAFKVMT